MRIPIMTQGAVLNLEAFEDLGEEDCKGSLHGGYQPFCGACSEQALGDVVWVSSSPGSSAKVSLL